MPPAGHDKTATIAKRTSSGIKPADAPADAAPAVDASSSNAAKAAAGKPTTGLGRARRNSKIKPVPAWLDHTLTVSYLTLTAYVIFMFWKQDGPDVLLRFFGLLGATAVAIRLTKWFFRVFGSFLSSFLTQKHVNDPLNKNALVMTKWCDQSWQLTIHATMTMMELYILRDEPWWDNTKTVWEPSPLVQQHKFSLRLFYWIQLAIWIYTAFSHRFFEKRRKDYVVMFVHHIATIMLIGGSYFSHNLRIGVLVLLLHDMSDIPLDCLKMVNYLRLQDKHGWFLSEFTFFVNYVSWIYLRLWTFPTKLIYTTFFEAHRAASLPEDQGNFWKPPATIHWWRSSNFALGLLWVMHIYWFYLLSRILSKVVLGDLHAAGAEEYEGDSDDEN